MRDADGAPRAVPTVQNVEAWRLHRLEQKRRWADLPLADIVAALQEMAETADWLAGTRSEVREAPADEG